MLPEMNELLISGERPTRAVPQSRAEVSFSSVVGNGPWGRTRAGPRGPVLKWSERDEPVRFRFGGVPCWCTPPLTGGSMASSGVAAEIYVGTLSGPGACLPESAGKIAIDDDRGNPHVVLALAGNRSV